jgi:hypothetical protein
VRYRVELVAGPAVRARRADRIRGSPTAHKQSLWFRIGGFTATIIGLIVVLLRPRAARSGAGMVDDELSTKVSNGRTRHVLELVHSAQQKGDRISHCRRGSVARPHR